MFIALVFLAHIYVDLIVSATNVLVVFLSTINKHFLLLLLLNRNAIIWSMGPMDHMYRPGTYGTYLILSLELILI